MEEPEHSGKKITVEPITNDDGHVFVCITHGMLHCEGHFMLLKLVSFLTVAEILEYLTYLVDIQNINLLISQVTFINPCTSDV